MVGRLGRGLVFAGFLTFAGALPGVAQGALSGEIVAADVAGYVVIACFADAELGCDEARSGVAEIAGGGTRAAWTIEGLERGPFLVLGWRDVDGDGEAQENELVVLSDAAGQPMLVNAPAAGLVLRAADAVPDGPVRRSPSTPVASPPATPATPPPAPAAPAPPAAAGLHPDLVGVWQQTRASGGDYRDLGTNQIFSMTSGFTTMLKLRADGTFLFRFYSSGVASDCLFVSQLDSAIGHASIEGGALVLQPTERSVEVSRCARSGTYEPGLDPIVMAARLDESFDFEGHRTWKLALEGGPVPLDLTLLHRPPSPTPPQPAQPEDFVLGADLPYSEVVGLWSTHPHSDLGFFDPATDAWYVPEPNGARHLWIRFPEGGGYELARAWPSYNLEGVCKKDYVYYERGQAQFAVTENPGGLSTQFVGHARFVAQDARLLVNVRACGQDDGATLHALTPQVSYYRWMWSAAHPAGWYAEVLQLSCDWQLSEWQFLVCDGSTYGRRE